MTRTRIVVLLVCAGVLAGAVGALALPRAPRSAPPRLDVERLAPTPHLDPTQSLGIHVVPGTRRIAVRAEDPAGGPPWAVEVLRGSYILPPGVPRRHIGKELFGLRTCLRLGRMVGERFGWLDGSGTFRPAGTSSQELPTRCRRDGDTEPVAFEETRWISHPTFGEAQPLARVIWGPTSNALTVTGSLRPVTTANGAFVTFMPPGGRGRLEVRASGKPLGAEDVMPPRQRLPAVTFLGAQAPDPEGGAPYGVSVGRMPDGRWCYSNAGRIVNDRVGGIDPRLDTFNDQTGSAYQCGPDHPIEAKYRVLTRAQPLSYMFGGGGLAGPASAGRIALRTLPTTTVFAGITRADVRTIRVTAPTQTRVLRPSGPAHAFVVPFNGEFPAGSVSFDITYTDGTVVHQGEDPSL